MSNGFIFNLGTAHAVPNDGTYYLQANSETGGAGTSITSTDYKVTNFTIGEAVGGKPKGSDTASVCEAGGSGICKVSPGWLFTRTKFAASGNFSSKDFLLGESAQTIDSFTYRMTALPAGTSATIQFSQDGSSWYNSSGTLNGSNTLSTSTNTISLSALSWTAGTFYYKAAYSGPGRKTPALDSVVLVYGGTAAKIRPIFVVSATDGQSDYLRYKIKLCTDAGMTANCQTFDQTASQAGWSGQNAAGSSAYLSGYQAFYTMQSDLTRGLTYYWQAWAIDPAGTNVWSAASTVASFTTNAGPNAPTISVPSHGAANVGTTPAITLAAIDGASDWLRYKIQIDTVNTFNSANLQTFDETISQTGWSGQNSQNSTAYTSGSNATYTTQSAILSGKRYFVRAYVIDPGGANAWSSASSTISFLTGGVVGGPCTSLAGGDIYVDESCYFTGASEGVDAGNLTVRGGATLTLNSNQTLTWSPGNSITIDAGSSIAISTTGATMKETPLWMTSSGSSGYPDPIGFHGAVMTGSFDDASGSYMYNQTSTNFYGSATGTTVMSGRFGNARYFNGTSDFITMGNPSDLALTGSMTVSAWVNPAAYQTDPDYSTIIAKYDAYYFGLDGTGHLQVKLNGTTPSTYQASTGTVPLNTWSHVAFTYDGSALKIYINGTLDQTVTMTGSVATTSNQVGIGASLDQNGALYSGYNRKYKGMIDESQVFNRALSEDEFRLMSNPIPSGLMFLPQITPPDASLYRRRKDIKTAAPALGDWKFDETTGTDLQNSTVLP